MSKMELIEKGFLKDKIQEFNIGDTIRVHVKIVEEEKVRIQPFEGIVIRKRGSGTRASFTVRRISYGEGIERVFPLHSPNIDKIEVIKEGKVRRAKLYYLRKKIGKGTKVDERKNFHEKGTPAAAAETQEPSQEPPEDSKQA
ncbi:MAG: 50S ribosomal protein L19 [Candidatus Omnitrophota bacterium]